MKEYQAEATKGIADTSSMMVAVVMELTPVLRGMENGDEAIGRLAQKIIELRGAGEVQQPVHVAEEKQADEELPEHEQSHVNLGIIEVKFDEDVKTEPATRPKPDPRAFERHDDDEKKVEGRKRDHMPTPSPARQQQKGKKKKRNNTVQVIVRINSHPDLSWRLKKNTTIGKIRAQIAKKYPFKSHIVHGTTILQDGEKLKDICGNWQEVFLKVVEVNISIPKFFDFQSRPTDFDNIIRTERTNEHAKHESN